MPLEISFVKTKKGAGRRITGKLKWCSNEFEVVTGGYGKGPIPDGLYDIEVFEAGFYLLRLNSQLQDMVSEFIQTVICLEPKGA